MLMSSSKLLLFSKDVHLNSGERQLLELYCVCSHQACCLLYYLGKINSGIHMYQFTFEPLHFCFWMWLWFRIWIKILADRWVWRKKGTDQQICIPLFTPLQKEPYIKLRLRDKKFTSYVVVLFSSLWAPIGKTVFILLGYYATCSVELKGP